MCLAAGSARPPIHPPKLEPTGGEEQRAAEAPQAEAAQQPGPSGRRSASPHPSGRRSVSPHPSAGGMWLALMPHTCVTWKSNFNAPKVTFYVGPTPSRVPQNSFELLAEKAPLVSNPGHLSHDASSHGLKEGAVRGLQPAAQVAEHKLPVSGQPKDGYEGLVGVWAALTVAMQGCTAKTSSRDVDGMAQVDNQP